MAVTPDTAIIASVTDMFKGMVFTTGSILLARIIEAKIWPLFATMSSALAGLVVKLVPKWIFKRTVPGGAAATTGAENEVELEVHEEGTAPSQAQVEDV